MLRSLVLYTALLCGANTAFAGSIDWDAVKAAGLDRMRPVDSIAAPDTVFFDKDGSEVDLTGYRGQVVLVNFWATWCAPCREEMPSLDALQAQMGGDDFQVVTIAAGRNPIPSITKFFDEQAIKHLPILLDPKQRLTSEMGVRAMPVSVLLDREGNEIARALGDADWSSQGAQLMVTQAIAP